MVSGVDDTTGEERECDGHQGPDAGNSQDDEHDGEHGNEPDSPTWVITRNAVCHCTGSAVMCQCVFTCSTIAWTSVVAPSLRLNVPMGGR